MLGGRNTLHGLIDAVARIVLAVVVGALYEDKTITLDLSADSSAGWQLRPDADETE
jgi:hypothetical protein